MASVGDHYRLDGAVYRVVGAGDPVALLRVADGEGRREHTGDLRQVPASEAATLEPAPDPDDGLHPVRALRGMAQGLYWNVRKLLP